MSNHSMKVPHGTARKLRRVGLVQGWRHIIGAVQMAPAAKHIDPAARRPRRRNLAAIWRAA